MSGLATACEDFRKRGGMVDLADRLKLLFTGADRVRYINGQVTANVAAAKNPGVLRACVTTAKGKLCGDVHVSLGPSGILIDADASLAESLPARLERYIIADDVTMENATQTVAIVHFMGMPLEALPPEVQRGALPSNRFGMPGWDFFPPFRKDLPPIWDSLTARFPVLPPELLEIIRIERGVPKWGFELHPDTLPAEAGLDRTHVDFHKGCYIGQEVISRIESVGKVNRELRGFVAGPGEPLTSGARVFSATDPARELGQLTSATISLALDRPIALGYLRRGAPENELLARVENSERRVPVALHPLPFVE